MTKLTIRTSDKAWLTQLAEAYKSGQAVNLIDDANLDIDPATQNILSMAWNTGASPRDIAAIGIACGMSVTVAALFAAAFLDPEPTSSLAAFALGGSALTLTGGVTAIAILTGRKPPNVSIGQDGFELSWE